MLRRTIMCPVSLKEELWTEMQCVQLQNCYSARCWLSLDNTWEMRGVWFFQDHSHVQGQLSFPWWGEITNWMHTLRLSLEKHHCELLLQVIEDEDSIGNWGWSESKRREEAPEGREKEETRRGREIEPKASSRTGQKEEKSKHCWSEETKYPYTSR